MKKTYVTSMPNKIGAFLKASACFANLGINITRVSYNKAVDSHKLFIDAEGTAQQLAKASAELERIGYLNNDNANSGIVLLEFRLPDVPGSVTDVLELIDKFNFNISYISSQENGSDYQYFKMGLCVSDSRKISEFINAAEKLCRVRIIDYNGSEKFYDNSFFYSSYVAGLVKIMNLSAECEKRLTVNVNLAMQTLDEKGLSPYRTFDSINGFAELLAQAAGESFNPRITHCAVTENTQIILIEPPCGSNTAIIKSNGEYLFVDSGYACYKEEMRTIFGRLIPDFDNMKKTVLLTHADVDHCGLLPIFDEIIASVKSIACLKNEYEGKNGFREENPLHKPYINICKILTSYRPPEPHKLKPMCEDCTAFDEPLVKTGEFAFGELRFDVYEGAGGHLPGEIVLIDRERRIAFTGDVYINVHGLTPSQAQYNKYAPILMTSVDTDPALCTREREAFTKLLGKGEWQIFGAHGLRKEITIG